MSRRPAAIPAFLLYCAACCFAPGSLPDAAAAAATSKATSKATTKATTKATSKATSKATTKTTTKATTKATTNTPTQATTNPGKDLDQQRTRFREAHDLAERGDERWRVRAEGLSDEYPLYPYLEQAAFLHDLPHAEREALVAFLERHGDAPFARTLRRSYLKLLARDARWPEFLALYAHEDDLGLRCAEVAALSAQNAADPVLPERARAILSAGKPLPVECAGVEAYARTTGLLTAEFQWERIERAADARQAAEMRALAEDLPEGERAEALRYAALLGDPKARLADVATWTDTPRARAMVARALARVAGTDSMLAGKTWLALEPRFAWSEAERARALAQVAIERASSYAPDAAEWLARVPESGYDQRLAEWRLRVQLARQDWPAAQKALARLGKTSPTDARARYWQARVAELGGDGDGARTAYTQLVREPNYFGFLAAERTGLPYTLCPRDGAVSAETRARVEANPALRRAFELRAIGWDALAHREWDYALRSFAQDERLAAVAAAQESGWTEQGPFTLLRPEEARYYVLRFPIAHEKLIVDAAGRHGLEPAMVLGLIRTESAWNEDAVSSAKARGLMQLLPSVAQNLAQREKIKYPGAAALDRPDLNVALGTRNLADVIGHYQGRTWVALAAYNAGAAPVGRWLAARGELPADLWVETVPYKETREYVERVLAFSAIYGWRRDGKALALPAALANIEAADAKERTPYRDVVCPVPLADSP